MPVTPKPASHIDDLARSCTEFVRRALDVELDYTSETLPVLDHYLLHHVDQITSEKNSADTPLLHADIQRIIAPAAGAYFGQVICNELGHGRWHCPSDDFPNYRLELERCFLCFNPMGAAFEAMMGRAVQGWNAHFFVLPEDQDFIAEALQSTAAVGEGDFFRLSVRFDALEHIESLLIARTAQEGRAEMAISAELYAQHVPSEGLLDSHGNS